MTPAQYASQAARAMARAMKRYRKEHGVSEQFMADVFGITVKFYRRCEEGRAGRLPAHKAMRYCDLFPKRERYAAMARFFGDPPLSESKKMPDEGPPALNHACAEKEKRGEKITPPVSRCRRTNMRHS